MTDDTDMTEDEFDAAMDAGEPATVVFKPATFSIPGATTWSSAAYYGRTVLAADITDATAVGRAVLTAKTRAEARATLGVSPERSPAWVWSVVLFLAVVEPVALWLVLR